MNPYTFILILLSIYAAIKVATYFICKHLDKKTAKYEQECIELEKQIKAKQALLTPTYYVQMYVLHTKETVQSITDMTHKELSKKLDHAKN